MGEPTRVQAVEQLLRDAGWQYEACPGRRSRGNPRYRWRLPGTAVYCQVGWYWTRLYQIVDRQAHVLVQVHTLQRSRLAAALAGLELAAALADADPQTPGAPAPPAKGHGRAADGGSPAR
jgi:hypothetical protein